MLNTVGVGQSEPGQVRSQNEDRFVVDDRLGVYIVCDGIGGHPGGEEAAELAQRTIVAHLEDVHELLRAVRLAHAPASHAVAEVQRALKRANDVLYRRDRHVPKPLRMGTTAAVLLTLGWQAVVANVGDSRIYRYRNRRVEQLTRDHTVARKLADDGLLPEDEVNDNRFSSVLTESLGSSPNLQVSAFETRMAPGDRYLLCSDGLSDYLEHPSQWALRMQEELTAVPRQLITLANHYDGHDNMTAVVVEVVDEHKQPEEKFPPSRPVSLPS